VVCQGPALVGVLTRSDILGFLMLKQ
jgi:hypothetical protein